MVVCASKKSPECSMAVELEFGMMFECSMLGVIGEEMALQRSSAKMLFQFSFNVHVVSIGLWNVYRFRWFQCSFIIIIGARDSKSQS